MSRFKLLRLSGFATGALLVTSSVAFAADAFSTQPVFTSNAQVSKAITSFGAALNKNGSISYQNDTAVSSYLTAINSNPMGDFGPNCLITNYQSTFKAPTCSFGNPKGTKTVVVIGDSMAGEWVDPLDTIAQQRGWKLYAATKPDCLIADVTYNLTQIGGGPYTSCWAWRTAAYAWIKALHPYMIFVINATYTQKTTPYASQGAALAANRLLGYLSPKVSTHLVFLVQPTQIGNYGRSASQCLAAASLVVAKGSANATTNCYQTYGSAIAYYNVYTTAEQRALATVKPTWINTIPWFCDTTSPSGYCPPVIDHSVVYRDQWHPSTAYLHRLSTVLAPAIPN